MHPQAWAFEKLVDTKWGVVSMQYRQVDCSYKPAKPASYGNGKSQTPRRGHGYSFQSGK